MNFAGGGGQQRRAVVRFFLDPPTIVPVTSPTQNGFDSLDDIRVQFNLGRFDIVEHVLGPGGPGNDAADAGVTQDPGQGQLGPAQAEFGRDRL
jgi:hypothetical protein